MNKFLRSFKKDIVNHAENKYGKEHAKKIWAETEKIYHRFLSKIPYIGGSENFMSHNFKSEQHSALLAKSGVCERLKPAKGALAPQGFSGRL